MCRCDCRAWKKMARIGCLDERAVCFRCGKGYSVRLRSGLAFRRQQTKKGESKSILLRISFPGNPQATEEQMETALHSAAADFVLSLPDGLNTRCGEQGAGLSEGQAQRIAIARGLLRPGGILLLDEPTSALDEPTEQMLLQRLALRLHGKTLILVTHRDTVARFCNSVIRIKKSDRTR